MENEDLKELQDEQLGWKKHRSRTNRVFGGLIVVAIGIILLIRQLDVIELPYWLFSWPMLLIGIGLYIGVMSSFRNFAWLIVMLIGSVFLVDRILPDVSISTYIWPLAIITIGLIIMLSSGKKRCHSKEYVSKWQQQHQYAYSSRNAADYVDSVSVFGGIKKNIITKDFKGGEIVTILGGTEINLSQADLEGEVTLEVVQIFGGTRLVLPPHWEVKSELVAILGSIEDKRPVGNLGNYDLGKRLVLKGTSIFGGIELRSY